MAELIYSRRAFADLERLTDLLLTAEPAAAAETADLVLEAIEILGNHPLVGRAAERDLRELVISRSRTGYIALYSYENPPDTVLVLAIRHQREAGYRSGQGHV